MRKMFLFMMVTLDGFVEGPDHDLSWHNVDEEFNQFAAKQMQEMGTILFGRRTYELMYEYWPHEQPSDPDDKIVADLMNTLPKVVVSHTLEKVEEEDNWKNVRLVKEHVAGELARLKEEPGKPASPGQGGDIAVLGSNNLCVTLLELGLLDELRIMINPVAIGEGTPLFAGIQNRYKFELTSTRKFTNGNVLLTYSLPLR